MGSELTINERLVTVTDDFAHIKENVLTCMIEIPFTQSNTDSYYLCFSQGANDYDLQQTNYNYTFSCRTEGYTCSKHKHDFAADALTHLPDCISNSVWQTVGVLIAPEKSSTHKRSIDITLSQIVNFVEGNAPICLYRIEKGLFSTKYEFVAQETLCKSKNDLAIEEFSVSPALITPGERVKFTWSLKAEKSIRLHPFMTEFSTNVTCPYEAVIGETTDAVLSVRNFIEGKGDVPEEMRATVEKALRVVTREPQIRKLALSAKGKPETDKLIVARGVPVTLSWEVVYLGARTITIDPPVKPGPLKVADSAVFTPDDDCVYTLIIGGKEEFRASVAVQLDEVLIRKFEPLNPSVMYGEQAYFSYALKNAETAAISPGIPSLDIRADRASCAVKPSPTAREVTYTLSCTGRTPGGTAANLSRTCKVTVADFMEIKDFSVKCDTVAGEYSIKVLSWNISYPQGEVAITIYVDDKQVLCYNERSRLTHTEYINVWYRRSATLVCVGSNGQIAKKMITR